ncbi:DNA polymerase III subunit beta [Methylobacter sp.]|uniref:DNA polymerase III subunit beta n=1 Tax=Methylobacter sp. TaxID=2051955 RepID=UPI0011FB6798|nr:DNA polymerase III subunit beta [Methylobacter sp.]TAK63351.1 MAG: DNA polymerase III subunit beta [Methylobacter sp.]
MKFIINREEILLPLQQIVSVIEKRQTMPILSNVLMVIEEDQLILTGTDLEIQIIAKINISTAVPGSITVPARKFLDICRLLPSGAEIKFELHDDIAKDGEYAASLPGAGAAKVKIASNRSRFSLSCLPAASYPEFAESELENHLFINAGKFKKALDKTVFCMANQDVRYYLNGLLLNVSNSKLKLVASDGHRLSIYEDILDQATGFESRIILPRKGVLELSRLLDDPDAELKVEFSSNNIRIFIKNLIFSAKLVDSKYPDFGKVFQQEFFNQIHIQKQILKDALTRVAILSNEKFKGVTFDITSESLKISTHNPEHDEAEEELFIEYTGEPLTIAFNAQYLLDAVSNLDSELAVLTIASNASSCFIDEPSDCGYKFIVMPMRL